MLAIRWFLRVSLYERKTGLAFFASFGIVFGMGLFWELATLYIALAYICATGFSNQRLFGAFLHEN